MGIVKRLAEQHDARVQTALGMLLQEGYAEECEVHSDSYYVSDGSLFDDIVEKAKAEKLWKDEGVSEKEVAEIFRDAMLQVGGNDECGICANNRDRDD